MTVAYEPEGRSPLFRIVRNAASMLVGSASGELLTTYAVALAALSLGTAGFGTLATAQAFVEPFQSLAGFGLGSVAVMLAAQRGGVDRALRGTLFGILAAMSLIAALLALALGAISGRGGPMGLVAISTLGMAIAPLGLVATLPLQFDQAMHRVVLLPFLVSLARLGTAYLAYYFLRSAVGFQLSATFAGILSTVLLFLAASRYYRAEFSFDRALARQLLSLAWPAALLEFVVMAYMRGSYFLLHDAGPAVQGDYAAADRLVRPVLGLAGALTVSALPTVARIAMTRQFARLNGLYVKTIVRVLLALVPLAATAALLAPWLVRRFAPMYVGATAPFRILLLGVLCMFLNQLSSTFIIAMGRFRLILVVAVGNFIVYLGLAVHLIPRYGATGAAIATTTMEAINTLIQVVLVFFLLRNAAASTHLELSDADSA